MSKPRTRTVKIGEEKVGGRLKKILDRIDTPEFKQKMKEKRDAYKKSLTLEFQLGRLIGEKIVDRYLPILSTDLGRSKNLIQVDEADTLEHTRLHDEWFSTTKYGNNWNSLAENGDFEKWNVFRDYAHILTKKYLPSPLVCHVDLINVDNLDELKRGIISSLCDSDICSYDVTNEKIKIYDDESYFTVIELEL